MEQYNLNGLVRLYTIGSDMPSPWFPLEYVEKHMAGLEAQGVRVGLVEQGKYKQGIDMLLYCIKQGIYVEVELQEGRRHLYYLDGSWYIGEQPTEEVWARLAIQNHYMSYPKEWEDDLPYIERQYQVYKGVN